MSLQYKYNKALFEFLLMGNKLSKAATLKNYRGTGTTKQETINSNHPILKQNEFYLLLAKRGASVVGATA